MLKELKKTINFGGKILDEEENKVLGEEWDIFDLMGIAHRRGKDWVIQQLNKLSDKKNE